MRPVCGRVAALLACVCHSVVAARGCGGRFSVAVLVSGHPTDTKEGPVEPLLRASLGSVGARLVDPMRAAGHDVFVFFCQRMEPATREGADAVEALRAEAMFSNAVTAVWYGSGMWERRAACWASLPRAFDWIVVTRPDLVLWGPAPDLASMDPAAVHSRLVAANNVTGLRPDHFVDHIHCELGGRTSDCCCHPGACASSCVLYDDQVAFVPAALAAAYFSVLERWAPPSEEECAWTRSEWAEGHYTRALLRSGARITPLPLLARLARYGELQLGDRWAKLRQCFPGDTGAVDEYHRNCTDR